MIGMGTEDSSAVREVKAQIERLRRDLLASVERQAETADDLTQFVPEAVRRRIMANIEEVRARLVAYGEETSRSRR